MACTSSGSIPGACAPSTSVSTPLAASRSTSAAIGKTIPVGLVTWSSTARRVRGVTRSSTASTTASACVTGVGTIAVTTRAPVSRATKSSRFVHER